MMLQAVQINQQYLFHAVVSSVRLPAYSAVCLCFSAKREFFEEPTGAQSFCTARSKR